MELTERIKQIILQETGVDVSKISRKRNVIEMRSLYYYLIKHYNPKMTLENIADIVDKNHATIIHSLNKYFNYEKYNPELKTLRKTITNIIDEENLELTENIEILKAELKKKNVKILGLELEIEKRDRLIKELKKARRDNKIIDDLNSLLITANPEQQELITLRLQAFYDMNSKIINNGNIRA